MRTHSDEIERAKHEAANPYGGGGMQLRRSTRLSKMPKKNFSEFLDQEDTEVYEEEEDSSEECSEIIEAQ